MYIHKHVRPRYTDWYETLGTAVEIGLPTAFEFEWLIDADAAWLYDSRSPHAAADQSDNIPLKGQRI